MNIDAHISFKPYITKAYFGMADPPVNLAKIAIGDGTVGSEAVYEHLPVVRVLETTGVHSQSNHSCRRLCSRHIPSLSATIPKCSSGSGNSMSHSLILVFIS